MFILKFTVNCFHKGSNLQEWRSGDQFFPPVSSLEGTHPQKSWHNRNPLLISQLTCFTRLNFSLLLNESYLEGRQSHVVCSSQLIRNQWPSVVELINAIWKKLTQADRNHVNYSDRDHCVTQGHGRTAWTQTHVCPMTHTITWITDMHDFIIHLYVPLFMCIYVRYFDSKWILDGKNCLCQRCVTALRLTEDFMKWIPAKNVRKHLFLVCASCWSLPAFILIVRLNRNYD